MEIREYDGQFIFDWLMAVHDRIWKDTNWPIVTRCYACCEIQSLILKHREEESLNILIARLRK